MDVPADRTGEASGRRNGAVVLAEVPGHGEECDPSPGEGAAGHRANERCQHWSVKKFWGIVQIAYNSGSRVLGSPTAKTDPKNLFTS